MHTIAESTKQKIGEMVRKGGQTTAPILAVKPLLLREAITTGPFQPRKGISKALLVSRLLPRERVTLEVLEARDDKGTDAQPISGASCSGEANGITSLDIGKLPASPGFEFLACRLIAGGQHVYAGAIFQGGQNHE